MSTSGGIVNNEEWDELQREADKYDRRARAFVLAIVALGCVLVLWLCSSE